MLEGTATHAVVDVQEPNRTSATYERSSWLFALAFALLISHELDAMLREEWLLLPGFDQLSSGNAADLFNVLHVPLFALITWALSSSSRITRRRTMIAVEVFLLGHAVAHTFFRSDIDYQFEAPVETLTVYGAAAVSFLHLSTGWINTVFDRKAM